MSNTICILPFIHLYSEPKGEVKPCCIGGGFDNPLNLKTMSIDEAFNSDQMKQLRKDMLNGVRNKVCDVCYKQEDLNGTSPRIDFNNNQLWTQPEVKEDYSVEPQFQHIDIRFSNLCNFKCRMCTHEFSSNWYEDMDTFHDGYTKRHSKVMKVTDNIVDELIPHLNNIKSFYFAGGEPLIMPEHYKLLKWLYNNVEIDEHTEKRKLSIHYNTNLSVIKYNEEDLVKLWRGFNRVFLSISCDGIGKVGEYQRTGFKTETFVKNLNTIRKYFKPNAVSEGGHDLFYNFQYTTTIWNIYHIFDFISFMKQENFIECESQIDFYYSWVPHHTSLNNLTLPEKKKVLKFIEDNIHSIKSEKTIKEINNIANFVKSDGNIDSAEPNRVVLGYTQKLDKLHGTNGNDLDGVDFDAMYTNTEPRQ